MGQIITFATKVYFFHYKKTMLSIVIYGISEILDKKKELEVLRKKNSISKLHNIVIFI